MFPYGKSTTTVDAGTVRVGVREPATVEYAWLVLRDPDHLCRWFKELHPPWRHGQSSPIEFGDSDFFVVTPTEIVEGRVLSFDWSFHGVGSVQQICWTVMAKPECAEMLVEDTDAARGAADAEQMLAGWTDFSCRLARYLATGAITRDVGRTDIDGSVVVPHRFRPLRMDTIYRWLPVASDGFKPRWFFIIDDEGPHLFQIGDRDLELDRQLTFAIAMPHGAVDTTSCLSRAATRTRGCGSRTPAGTGWACQANVGEPCGAGSRLRGSPQLTRHGHSPRRRTDRR